MNKSTKTLSPVLIFNILLAVIVLFLLSQHFLKNEKIAYVDSAKPLNDYKGAALARKAYEAKAKTWQANIDTLTAGCRVLLDLLNIRFALACY